MIYDLWSMVYDLAARAPVHGRRCVCRRHIAQGVCCCIFRCPSYDFAHSYALSAARTRSLSNQKVLSYANCTEGTNHGVLAVGYGTCQPGATAGPCANVTKQTDYWKVKNSWGTTFGVHVFRRFQLFLMFMWLQNRRWTTHELHC